MFSSLTLKRKLAEYVLNHTNPEKLQKLSEQRAIRAVKSLAKNSPRYHEILALEEIDSARVKSIGDFRRIVPLLSKERLFAANSSADLLRADNGFPAAITSSSGRGGQYSFAPVNRRQAQKTSAMIDLGLALHFQSDRLKTLIINCLPMGVFVPSDANTVINVSVREDTAIAAAETFAANYQQLIFLCDPLFAKKLADQARASRLDWAKHRVHLLCGGETCGENFRRYLADCFQIDLTATETGSVRASMGMGEIGLNLMFETPKTLALKNFADQQPDLQSRLFGAAQTSAAMLFAYDPARSYLEIAGPDRHGVGALAVSDCDQLSSLPLVRYLTGDRARIVPPDALAGLEASLDWPASCFDSLPMLALFGRQKDMLAPTLSVSDIKDGLYAEPDTARALTGAFRVRKAGERLLIDVQMKADHRTPRPYIEALENRLADYGGGVEIDLQPYTDFCAGGAVDYERKFPYYQARE